MAEIVMELLFKTQLSQLNLSSTFLKKYVDDIILALPENLISPLKTKLEEFKVSNTTYSSRLKSKTKTHDNILRYETNKNQHKYNYKLVGTPKKRH